MASSRQETCGIAVVAHEPGGATYLAPIIEALYAAGHLISLFASGPAENIWRTFAEKKAIELMPPGPFDAQRHSSPPNLLVTGTSHYSEFERSAWRSAKKQHVPSVAFVDAWSNFPERFYSSNDNAFILPDAIGVIDDWSSNQLCDQVPGNPTAVVVGQPHLERLVSAGKKLAPRQSDGNSRFVFFSNPTPNLPDGGPSAHAGQARAETVLAAMAHLKRTTLTIKPHPSESIETWTSWRSGLSSAQRKLVQIRTQSAQDAIANADVVIGISSMVLIESALMGRPTISISDPVQPNPNPMIERIPEIVSVGDAAALVAALSMISSMPSTADCNIGIANTLKGSLARALTLTQAVRVSPL